MRKQIDNILKIRYVKLHFTLTVTENTILPASKASALRGGIGEMLLRANCISDRNCEVCSFESECLVQRTMYSKLTQKPAFLQVGDSFGYVIECEDYREEFQEGDSFPMNLILFGKTIVYFNQYLQSLAMLGQSGLGKYNAHFVISRITNTKGEDILEGQNIYMKRYQISTLQDYILYRKKKLQLQTDSDNISIQLRFKTPVTLKYQGEFLRTFQSEAVLRSIIRRLYILACFEDIEAEDFYRTEYPIPMMDRQSVSPVSVRRFSNRQEQAMYLKGIKGSMDLEGVTEDLLSIYLAGELVHIGKNTSFGFGRYQVREEDHE